MNRIILIGNGFDLAHKMKTSYKSFIDDYWTNTIAAIQETALGRPFENGEIKINHSPSRYIAGTTIKDLEKSLNEHNSTLEFKNIFLKEITNKTYLNNWVDVENEYYSLLKKTFQDSKNSENYDISNLNLDFKRVKDLLELYLTRIEKEFNSNISPNILRIKTNIGNKVYSPFKLKDFSETSVNQRAEIEYNSLKENIIAVQANHISINEVSEYQRNIIKKLGKKDHLNQIKKMLLSDSAINYFDLIPEQTLFLNFNYTFTELLYENPKSFYNPLEHKYTSVKFNHIHGTTDKMDKNPIIFGFGDEIDKDYSVIEELNDNRYLENIKSINYLESDNYKRLLEFINSDYFQIFILGHSCGISDRTLLNTMFEHDNCASIKLFYHQKENDVDNYSDIIRNISRNFNDKAKMRDRVVNKTYCESLN
ncbi:bacteriophage abortive infection AbiH family protein [Gaetbulibacter sp. NE]|uniref:bacteriophage abortive infection AbiH family protein n=1 Tax=Gaetbulibacter sp. NE TaxID=2982307 RepID=UPI0021D0D840|nr:bacteriophage abortive infection AbiH family protein [Gaetbulibacter sp. NE]